MQIKETMQNYGYTPTTLAKKMGVFDSTVSRLMKGNPTVDKLDDLACQIGCHRWEFFLDEIFESEESIHRILKEFEAVGYKVLDMPIENNPEITQSEPSMNVFEESRFLRLQFACPQCGKSVKISIEKG